MEGHLTTSMLRGIDGRAMLKSIIFLVITVTLVFSHSASPQETISPGTDFPQSQSIIQMLRAVEAGDAELLINCFTVRAKADLLSKYGKEKLLDIHRQLFMILHLYPFKTEDFAFVYKPRDSSSGRIVYYYKGEKVKNAGSPVRLEDGEWRIEE
jgi:hypothetical protein